MMIDNYPHSALSSRFQDRQDFLDYGKLGSDSAYASSPNSESSLQSPGDQRPSEKSVSSSDSDKTPPKRVYFCQRCLNHGRREPRKNHKCECPFASCTCDQCYLVEKRRFLNSQLHELEEQTSIEIKEEPIECDEIEMAIQLEFIRPRSHQRIKGERIPNCQKCGQHGRKNRLKGHKRVCPYKDCTCAKCQVVSERQKLMADQIKIRRRQRKDTIMSLTRESISATLSALGQMPSGNMNNLMMYNRMKPCVDSNHHPASIHSTPTTDSITRRSPLTSIHAQPATANDISSLILRSSSKPINHQYPLTEIPKATALLDPLLLPLAAPSIEPITSISSVLQAPHPLLPSTPVSTPTFGISDTIAMLSSLGLPLTPPNSTASSCFQFPMLTNEQILQQIILNYQLLTQDSFGGIGIKNNESEMETVSINESSTTNGAIIDVCSV